MRNKIELGRKIGVILRNCDICKRNINAITKENADLCPSCFEKVKRLTQNGI